MSKPFILALAFLLTGCAHAAGVPIVGCEANPNLQAERSAELQEIQKEDQADRDSSFAAVDWNKVKPRDLQRRIRVGKILAEGCLRSAADFEAAAMIYQHGTSGSQFLQAFIWAHEADKLESTPERRWLTAAGLDRYLVAIGRKQLFGTQLSRGPDDKWCLEPVEPSFPEKLRIRYVRFSVKQQTENTLKAMGSRQPPSEVKDCAGAPKPSPKGTVPGFW
jgi:hypothetical protein